MSETGIDPATGAVNPAPPHLVLRPAHCPDDALVRHAGLDTTDVERAPNPLENNRAAHIVPRHERSDDDEYG